MACSGRGRATSVLRKGLRRWVRVLEGFGVVVETALSALPRRSWADGGCWVARSHIAALPHMWRMRGYTARRLTTRPSRAAPAGEPATARPDLSKWRPNHHLHTSTTNHREGSRGISAHVSIYGDMAPWGGARLRSRWAAHGPGKWLRGAVAAAPAQQPKVSIWPYCDRWFSVTIGRHVSAYLAQI